MPSDLNAELIRDWFRNGPLPVRKSFSLCSTVTRTSKWRWKSRLRTHFAAES